MVPDGHRSIIIDARANGVPGAHGIARSVVQTVAHMSRADLSLPLQVLVNPDRPQLFPLPGLPGHIKVVPTDITPFEAHRHWQYARLLRAMGAGVLWVPHPHFTPLVRPCPVVVTIHDCILETDRAFAGGWRRQAIHKMVMRAVVRSVAATTAPTWASVAEIRHYYPLAPHLTMIPNGIDPAPFAAVSRGEVAAARQRYGLPEQFVLTVGARRPHKNHEILIRALSLLPPEVCLVIVGYPDTIFRDSLPGLISALGLESRVVQVPGVDDDALPAVYRAASVFAFPSLVEGFGLPVLEAMASGVPVVASDIPALVEVGGAGAVFVSPHDPAAWAAAIGAALSESPASFSLTERSAAAAAAVAGATWTRGATSLLELLTAIAAGDAVPALAGESTWFARGSGVPGMSEAGG